MRRLIKVLTGENVIMYLHSLANAPAGSVMLSMATRLIDQEAREEVGLAVAGQSNSNVPERESSRKRGRHFRRKESESVERQSEVLVTGLEGLSMRPDPVSEFQARHLGMAEASKGHAENVREILHALRDVRSMLIAL